MKRVIHSLRPLRHDRRGNALIEFAIGAFVLFATFAGTFQFGYTFYQYNLLENAVNDGARYAAMKAYDSTTATPSTTFSTAVKNMVVYGNPAPATGSLPIVPNLTTANISVSATFSSGTTGCLTCTGVPRYITVSVSNFTINSVFMSTTFNKPTVTYPYQGIYSPY